MLFDSLNPYESLVVVLADSPQDLVAQLKAIKTPIKIVAINQVGSRSVAYIIGDVRVQTKKKKGE